MSENNRFDNYRQLLQRVSAKFAEIVSLRPSQYVCQKGCFSCCKSGLTVTHIEKQHIKSWLSEKSDTVSLLYKLRDARPHGNSSCELLTNEGACAIYDVRPIICRSHGVPVKTPSVEPNKQTLDVCPLNLRTLNLNDLAGDESLNLETVSAILSVVDRHYDEKNAGKRVLLNIDEILA